MCLLDLLRIEISDGIKDLPRLRSLAFTRRRRMTDYRLLVSSILEMQKFLDEREAVEREKNTAPGETADEKETLPEDVEEKLLSMHPQIRRNGHY